MAEEFNTEGMLDIYLFENQQLLEQLQEMVLEQKESKSALNINTKTLRNSKEQNRTFWKKKNALDWW